MKIKFDMVLTATLVVCSIVTTGVVLRREFLVPSVRATRAEQKPIWIANWRQYLSEGARLGSEAAPVQIIEFADFECPYCGSFHKTLAIVRQHYPTQVSLTYVHFPIPGHRFALPAARVAECAGDQGRFEAMYSQLFDGQESFGLKPWSDYAAAAGVPDLAAFDACIRRTDSVRRIEGGKQLGAQLDIQATPTLIINGWKLAHPPSADELDAMVKATLTGKNPIFGRT
jgi:protein-disulfide isomerase